MLTLIATLLLSGCAPDETPAINDTAGAGPISLVPFVASTAEEDQYDGFFSHMLTQFVPLDVEPLEVDPRVYRDCYAELYVVPSFAVSSPGMIGEGDVCWDMGWQSETADWTPREYRDVGPSLQARAGEDGFVLEKLGDDPNEFIEYWWDIDNSAGSFGAVSGAELYLEESDLGIAVAEPLSGVNWDVLISSLRESGEVDLEWTPPTAPDEYTWLTVDVILLSEDGTDSRGLYCVLVDDGAASLRLEPVEGDMVVYVSRSTFRPVDLPDLGRLMANASIDQGYDSW